LPFIIGLCRLGITCLFCAAVFLPGNHMGNRISDIRPIDQPMQCDARTGVCVPTPLQKEAYGRASRDSREQTGVDGPVTTGGITDRVAQCSKIAARELSTVLGHLQHAQDVFNKQGMRVASAEYVATIRAADGIDQKSVARERETVKELLKNRSIDASTRTMLLKEDADLHMLQRAPGFTRCNFALRMIENGDLFNGVQLLLDAQKKDYEMVRDPEFQRHLRHAVESGQASRRVTEVQTNRPVLPLQQRTEVPSVPLVPPTNPLAPPYQPSYELLQKPQAVQPTIPTYRPDPRFQQPQQPVIGDPRFQQPQQPVIGDPRFQQPQQPVIGDPRLQPPLPLVPGRVPPADVLLRRQTQQPDVTPVQLPVGRFAPLDAHGRSPVEASQAALAQVTGPKSMTLETRRQFEASIKNADTGVSPKLAFFQQQEIKAANVLKPLMGPDIAKVMVGFDQEVSRASQHLPPDKKRIAVQLYESVDKVPNAQERSDLQTQLVSLNPALKDILDRREKYLGPANVQLLLNYNGWKNAVQTEQNQVAITRYMFAIALSKNGDSNEAKLHMTDALKKNRDPQLTEFWKSTAKKMGL
jgi:hypothetical protein